MNAPNDRGEVLRFLRETEFELPVLPSVALDLLKSMHDDRADATSLALTVHADQGLAAHVLRLANSPYYRGQEAIDSLQQAVARLGLDAVHEMALAACFATTAFRIVGYEDRARRLWRHASARGFIAAEIARLCQVDAHAAYVCGLLRDIGKPVVLSVLSRRNKQVIESVDAMIAKMAPTVGIRLASAWQLPQVVQNGVTFGDDFAAAPGHRGVLAAVSVADLLVPCVLDAVEIDEGTLYALAASDHLGLTPHNVATLTARSDEIRAAVDTLPL